MLQVIQVKATSPGFPTGGNIETCIAIHCRKSIKVKACHPEIFLEAALQLKSIPAASACRLFYIPIKLRPLVQGYPLEAAS
jgi:hypothetical protein